MRPAIRSAVACFALVLAAGTTYADTPREPPQSPIGAMRADRWAEAEAIAARYADPVASKLVLYYRLLSQGAATTSEIADFIRTSPDWPAQALLERRREEALVLEPDNAVLLTQCGAPTPTEAASLLRCAAAFSAAGRSEEAASFARKAWVSAITDPTTEIAFRDRWGSVPTPDDEWARYLRLSWQDKAAAARQLAHLDPAHRALAEAGKDDPAQMLDRARALRRADDLPGAVTLWLQEAPAAQAAAPDHLPAFWAERSLLIRTLMQNGDDKDAYELANAHGQTGSEQVASAEFLAGFIALRRLKQPDVAAAHFQALARLSKAAITQGRAHYWLGRAAAAAGRDPRPDYQQAAAWATTFYGQLAAVALGDDPKALSARINALRDPDWNHDAALAFTEHEVVRAAAWLVAWGDPHRARLFLLRMDELAPTKAERALTAELALRVGLPDMAVFVARRMGRDGIPLPQAGWPIPYDPPKPPDAATALGIMRQESSFDVGAVSPSGARGLMQLMPATARAVARTLGVPPALPTLTIDPEHNMLLGCAYVQEMLNRFGGSLPLAAASYNAGPQRVDHWLGENGDPRTGQIDMIDWLELIPIGETRNYVQRVLENVAIYRARSGSATPTLLAQWTR